MKKFLALTLAILSLAFCVGFTACKDEEQKDSGKESPSYIDKDGWTGNY